MTRTEIKAMTKEVVIAKLVALGKVEDELTEKKVKELRDMLYNLTNENTENKEENTMKKAENTENTNTENTKKVEEPKVDKKAARADAKVAMIARVDAWAAAKANEKVTTKGYTNYPHVRDIKFDGKTVFQLWISANGVRLCGRTKLIPEVIRPAGATVIKDGFDLSIPTFTEVEADLDKYFEVSKKSLVEEKEAREKAKAEKKAAKEKAKAEKVAAEKKEEK